MSAESPYTEPTMHIAAPLNYRYRRQTPQSAVVIIEKPSLSLSGTRYACFEELEQIHYRCKITQRQTYGSIIEAKVKEKSKDSSLTIENPKPQVKPTGIANKGEK